MAGESPSGRFSDFLLAEYHHLAESFLRNEEDGEKRVTFLITLVAAFGAVLGLSKDSVRNLSPGRADPFLVFMLLALLVFGYSTYLRVIRRNLSTDRYKSGLARIRRYFVPAENDPHLEYLPFNPYKKEKPRQWKWSSFGKGGWLETVALVNSLIVGALVAILTRSGSWWTKFEFGALGAVAAWIVLIVLANRRYQRGLAD